MFIHGLVALFTWLTGNLSIYLSLAARRFVPLEIVDIIRDCAWDSGQAIWMLEGSVNRVRYSWSPTSTKEATGPETRGLRLGRCGWVGVHRCY